MPGRHHGRQPEIQAGSDYEPAERLSQHNEPEYGPHQAEAPMTPENTDNEQDSAGSEHGSEQKFWEAVHQDEDNYTAHDPVGRLPGDHLSQVRRAVRSRLTDVEARNDSLTDVPTSIKRVLELPTAAEAEQPEKRIRESLIAGIMGAALETSPHANEWMNRDEIKNLRRILGIPGSTSARLHKMPRNKWKNCRPIRKEIR